jgi:hypothetical protein
MTDEINPGFTITFPNGLTIRGPARMARELIISPDKHDGKYYQSKTRGRIPIDEMNENHIRNAITQRLIAEIEASRGLSLSKFIDYLETGVGIGDPMIQTLIVSLRNRLDEWVIGENHNA